MKTSVNKSFVLVIYMLSLVNVYAQAPPPPPPPGPLAGEVPIDENLLALLIIAIVFGMYTIYSQSIKAKKQH
jgi:hypothetical protein